MNHQYKHMNQNQGADMANGQPQNTMAQGMQNNPMMQQNAMNMQQPPMGNPYMQMQGNPMMQNPMGQGGMNPYMAQNNPYFQGQNNPYMNTQSSWTSWLGDTPSDKFLRGLLIGGAAAYILTNEHVQKAIIKAGLKVYGALAGGVEEFKEKIMDVKAEMEAEEAAKAE